MIAKIAKVKLFFEPQTQQQMFNRIAGTLIACIAALFIALIVVRWIDVRDSIYLSDGDTVMKISADNKVTFYKSR